MTVFGCEDTSKTTDTLLGISAPPIYSAPKQKSKTFNLETFIYTYIKSVYKVHKRNDSILVVLPLHYLSRDVPLSIWILTVPHPEKVFNIVLPRFIKLSIQMWYESSLVFYESSQPASLSSIVRKMHKI